MKLKTQRLLSLIATTTALSLPLHINGAETQASLEAVENCPTLISEFREAAIADMEKTVDANFQNAIRWGFCQYYDYGESLAADGAAYSPGVTSSGDAYGSAPNSASEYSETNVQVTGVDEADFVKNDGRYIYMLAHGKFRIVQAWPAEQASEIAAFEIEGDPKKLFVLDDRAFIYSSLDKIEQNRYNGWHYREDSECTYGYDCEFTGDGHELKITVLDLTEITQPKLVRELQFSGAYLNARRIGNAVYSAVIFPELKIPGIQYSPHQTWRSAICSQTHPIDLEVIKTEFENLKIENRQLIESADITEWLPNIKEVSYSGDTPQPEQTKSLFDNCDDFYRTQQRDSMHVLSIISTEINGEAPLQSTTIIGKPGAVYASHEALYVAAKHSQQSMSTPWFFNNDRDISEASTIHKFKLTNEPPASQYQGSGVVKGRVLNQFSMDEYEGYFRLATTTGHLPNPNTHSTLSILEEKSGELVLVGEIDNIAPTEDIRSARFIGDKGYIVTFKKTDPLFVFDLSDPRNPSIAGELKIPGFSTYMHRLDDDHLLTIGYDSDDQGDFAWFQGIMLQIFDVSNMRTPMLTHKAVIGTRGSTSEAATNHLAFNYFRSKGLLAIPITICENGQESHPYGGHYGDLMTFSGLLVYRVNADTGFELLGGVPHIAPEAQKTPQGLFSSSPDKKQRYMCSNWWTQSNSYVKRSIFMEDYVYSITEDTIKANSLEALGQDIAVIHFDKAPECDTFHADLCTTKPACQSMNSLWEDAVCRLPGYSPLRSSKNFSKICTASYDPETEILDLPCVNQYGIQYNATLKLTEAFPSQQLTLTKSQMSPINMASQGCEVSYNSQKDTVKIPCLNRQGSREIYWVETKVLNHKPLILELTDFGS
jgi:uncharacterized secreted protein with C-terminal beta-propeller domain